MTSGRQRRYAAERVICSTDNEISFRELRNADVAREKRFVCNPATISRPKKRLKAVNRANDSKIMYVRTLL